MKNFCLNCSHEQQYSGVIGDYYYCEKCGAKLHSDGSISYDGTREWIEKSKDQQRRFDRRD